MGGAGGEDEVRIGEGPVEFAGAESGCVHAD